MTDNNNQIIFNLSGQEVLQYILIICTILGLTLGGINLKYGFSNISIYVNLSLSIVSIFGLYLNKKNKTEATAILLITTSLVIITVNMIISDGLSDPGLLAFPIILIVSCLFLGSRAIIFISIIVIGIINVLGISELTGYLKVSRPTNIVILSIYNVLLITSSFISYFIIKNNEVKNNTIRQQNSDLENLVNQKDLLMKEIFHRVKNNLFLINALLTFNIDKVSNKQDKKIFVACQNQLSTMALIHERLYLSDNYENIDFKLYLDDLVAQYLTSELSIEKNISLSVITLISNFIQR